MNICWKEVKKSRIQEYPPAQRVHRRFIKLRNSGSEILMCFPRINAKSTAGGRSQKPEPRVILRKWRSCCTNSHRSPDPAESAATSRELAASPGTLDNRA